ncbi:S-layer homology domain-containing protein [Paenibacillus sp. UNCCL117]|uniref:immunoglobulin-like domain-containing protein n=1 Tax=unclassified Paenibacillus TaxID=185978 RepID=UPI00088E1924|nr:MULTISPECIES: immunoglobulin-like domain-containing protein [unclassified Paenibacillus]SDD07113.1 S-layer homology domain-containing protein [Paenibacillus sp. cl123]SFW31555.1 S-layer homology domain-containing protein [Paenibacillus sp. UNCCL117]
MFGRLWNKRISCMIVLSMMLSLAAGISSPGYAEEDGSLSTVVLKLSPTDDASINAANTGATSPSGTLILGANRQFMMKFDLSGITDPIESATLKLYKTNTNAANYTVYRSVYDNWSENTVTYANRPQDPPAENAIATGTASGGAGTMIPVLVTDAVKAEVSGDQALTLVFRRDNISASPGADLASKEHATAAWRPVLEVSVLKALTSAERVAADKAALLGQFHNKTVTANLTLPAEGPFNTSIVWTSDKPSVISGTGEVIRPAYTEADIPVTLTAVLAHGDTSDTAIMNVTVQKLPTPTDAQRVARDKELLIAKYNNMTVYEDVYLQTIGSYGFSTVTWTSDRPDTISDTGAVHRPAADGTDANVNMHATIQYGTAADSAQIQMLVPKLSLRTPALESSMTALLDKAELLLGEYSVGTGPGQVAQAARELFASKIQAARSALANPAGDLKLALRQLREAGSAYHKSTITSDRVVDAKANKLEFSEYRQTLHALIWEAETMLLIEPEMYTEASKTAVADQIAHARSVLDGSYKLPFVRHRAFYSPRQDEDIRYAIEHYSRASHPYSNKYGLKELIAWYPSSHILSGTYATIQLTPADDAFVWTSEKNKPHNGGTLIYGEGRTAYMKFDLSNVSGQVNKAELRVTNWKTDRNVTEVHYGADDSWSESTLLYPSSGEPALGPVVNTFTLGAKDAAGTGAVDLTVPVQAELLGDKLLTLSFSNAAGTRYASEIYAKETTAADKRPYLELSLNQIVDAKLQDKYERIIRAANDLLDQGEAGKQAWQYPPAAMDELRLAVAEASAARQEGPVEAVGAALVRVYDAMKAMRDAQVLRSESGTEATLYFTNEGLEQLRANIKVSPDLKAKYEEAKQLSDEQTLQDLIAQKRFLQDDVNYEALNAEYKLWSNSTTLNFTPPSGTASIGLQFMLDSADNEASGLGHAWIDSVKISPADTADLDIWNAGFEDGGQLPDHWTPTAVKGNPVLAWENRTNYADAGRRSIYIENPTANDQGAWASGQHIAVAANVAHTLTFAAKIDGKLKNGVKAVITYKNANGTALGSVELVNNRKSTIAPPSNLSVQADALVYAVTGDLAYAQKAKERIYLRLNDFLQGAEHWLVNDSRPDNIDAYGKVQGGRVASIVASALTFIKDSGVYSDEEYQDLIGKLNYMNLFLNDARDRHELDDYSVQLGASNWESDAVLGASMLSMVYPELDNSKQLIANANKLIKAQLQYAVGQEGEWPESIRYHVAVLQRFAAYAKSLRNQTGEDWFALPKLVKMFQYNTDVQTPPYAYADGYINSPIFGDDVMTFGNEFALLGVYYDEVARSNEALASKMYQTWVKAGSRLPANGAETILLESFFTPVGRTPAYVPFKLSSTDMYKGVGLVMFRNHSGTPKDTFMSVMANTAPLGHGHYDQGSFTLYAGSTPLVLDPGIESYFAGSTGWYRGSSTHATVQFRKTDNSGYLNTPAVSTNHAFATNSHLDMMSLQIADPNGGSTGSHTRSIAYIKNGFEAFIIRDQIQGASSGTIWNLPVAATKLSEINGNRIESTGHYGMDLETTVLQPANPAIKQEWGRSTNMTPSVDGEKKLAYIRIANGPNMNYLTVLYPKAKGAEGLTTEKLGTVETVDAYRLRTSAGGEAYAVINHAASPAELSLASDTELMDLKSEAVYAASGGTVSLSIAGNELVILMKPAVRPQWPAEAIVSSGQVTSAGAMLRWSAAAGAAGYDIRVGDRWYMGITDAVYTVTGLRPDTGYGVEVRAYNADGYAEDTIAGRFTTSRTSGSSDSDSDSDSDTPAPPTHVPGNPGHNQIPGGSLQAIGADGIVDEAALKQAWSLTNQVRIQLAGDSVLLPAAALAGAARNPDASVTISSSLGDFILPLKVLPLAGLPGTDGAKLKFRVTIQLAAASGQKSVAAAADAIGAKLLSPAIDFKLAATTEDGRVIPLDDFGGIYVKRTIALQGTVSPKAAVALYDEAAQRLSFVPGRINGGKAEFMRTGSSIYTVIELERTFSDMHDHWAKADIELLASKLIVDGAASDAFAADRSITRAEWASLLVRSLGLSLSGENAFRDVLPGDWYSSAVSTAVQAGIAGGYPDGTFRPDAPVTREELAAMLIRALDVAGSPAASLTAEQAQAVLAKFGDSSGSPWATTEMAQAVETGILQGQTSASLGALAQATRAEAAVMLKRFLERCGFID